MPTSDSIYLRFWGVRGSIACPGPETVRYGGNTPCLEVRCGDNLLILDGGTGIRALGSFLMRTDTASDADIFLTHCHLDHISGLPFFAPFFSHGHRFRMWAGNLIPFNGVEEMFRRMMSPPLFPIDVEVLKGELEFCDFEAGETLQPRPGVIVRTAPLDHPDGATGYRIEYGGSVLAYITDTEMRSDVLDPELVALTQGADLMVFDCTYTDDEIGAHRGWGHSTWRHGARLADQAGVKTLCLFHHDPAHDDAFMDAVAAEAAKARPGTIVATEGLTIEI
jgi:phosphoribosyl 1,2-cyclic phosphodiesterase